MSRRVVRALDLVQDAALIAAYEAHHAPKAVPRDIVRDLWIGDTGPWKFGAWQTGW